MKFRHRILGSVSLGLAIAITALAVVISHNSPCPVSHAVAGSVAQMEAVVARCYGSPETLTFENVPMPTAADNEILVKVHAAAVNPLDWHLMRGKPYLVRLSAGIGAPSDTRVGRDFAGTVAAVGKDVTTFKPGDAVFGSRRGALAEYLTVREDLAIVLKPANLTFEQAASVPIAAITALQGLRDKGQVRPGQKVLINGASGGVGTFAVQLAKAFGAEVTGVCSTRNVELVKSLGADHVIDYTQQDFTAAGAAYDVILDTVGNRSFAAIRRVLKSDGVVVIVGGQSGDPWLGPMAQPIKAFLLSPFYSQTFLKFLAKLNQKDLNYLGDLMREGKITPVIDRRYTLRAVPEAIAYLETGRARGKVIVNLEVLDHTVIGSAGDSAAASISADGSR